MVIVRKQIMLGDKLLAEGLITHQQLEKALEEQKRIKEKLGETLIKLGYITQDGLLPILASHIGVQFMRINFAETEDKYAEELTEDLFVELWVKRDLIDTSMSFNSYLHTEFI